MKAAGRVLDRTLFAILWCAVAAAALLTTAPARASTCALNSARGQIQHVIYIQFDNTHLRRDTAEVPSDLEQMPHLLNFIQSDGTLLANDHTILISHTAGGILSTLTGLYPDRHGQRVSNRVCQAKGAPTLGPIMQMCARRC